MENLFVYGTLKRGFFNHNAYIRPAIDLQKARYLETGTTCENFLLVVREERNLPCLIETKGHASGNPVEGEIYRVDTSVLHALDLLEGVNAGSYERSIIDIETGNKARLACHVYLKLTNPDDSLLSGSSHTSYTLAHNQGYYPPSGYPNVFTLQSILGIDAQAVESRILQGSSFLEALLYTQVTSVRNTENPIQSLVGDAVHFVQTLLSRLVELQLPCIGLEIDHICYRSSSQEEYELIKTKLLEFTGSSLLIETMISGRLISTIRLHGPIRYGPWNIPCIEVASPKPNKSHRPGLEHVELVLDRKNEVGFLDSREFLQEFVDRYPEIDFDLSAMDKHINADVGVDLGQGIRVKYHARPLYEVCAYEVAKMG